MAAGRNSDVNISDVIEVIETDEMYAGPQPNNREADSRRPRAYVKIIEQPASKALRFRYECEGRSAGSIPGVNSTPENKTYPGIQIVGYRGKAVVVVSCVTKDDPYRPHPHNLVGKEGCNRGICTLRMESDTMTFSNLGIQCVKKKDIEEALRVREDIRVDPFRTGFSHKVQPSSIDLNCVRLCFQVFLEGPKENEFTIPLKPVVSDPIYDKKAMSDLTICKLSDCSASVAGGKEIILLCEKVAKEDIQVRFYEERDGELYWEALGDFQPTQVHKQVAISFRTPKYKNIDGKNPVKVWVQLRRPSDGAVSESVPFQFVPLDSDQATLRRKRQKYSGESSPQNIRPPQDDDSRSTYAGSVSPEGASFPSAGRMLAVKREPSDTGSYMYAGNVSPMYHRTSPGPPSPNTSPSPGPYMYSNVTLLHSTGGGLIDMKPNESNPFIKADISFPSSGTSKPAPDSLPYVFPIKNPGSDLSEGALYVDHSRLAASNAPVKVNASNGRSGDVRLPDNITKIENDSNRSQIPGTAGNTMLDMDSQQYSLELNLGNLDSAELTRMAMMTDTALSENLSCSLTLDDKVSKSGMECDQSNMGDSFTRAADNMIQELVSYGNINQSSQQ